MTKFDTLKVCEFTSSKFITIISIMKAIFESMYTENVLSNHGNLYIRQYILKKKIKGVSVKF